MQTEVQADADALAAAFEAPTTLSPLAAAETHEPLDFEFHLEPDAPAPAVPSGLVALDLPDLQLPPATPDEASHQALLETDAPDIAPAWIAPGRNSPAELPRIAADIAELRGLSTDALVALADANAARVLRLLPAPG